MGTIIFFAERNKIVRDISNYKRIMFRLPNLSKLFIFGLAMKNDISKYINHKLIITDLQATDKAQAIGELVERIFEVETEETLGSVAIEEVKHAMLERERIQSTGLGNALAFPHARLEGFGDLAVAIGICKGGVDWGSLDGNDCNVICLMVSPTNRPYLILQTMALFSRFFSDTSHIRGILGQMQPEKIADMIKVGQMSISKSVLAEDVMRPVEKKVRLEDSVEEVARVMHLNRLDILPVVDDDDVLVGEISCLDIFSYGIPDFFNQLQTISFMKYLDPFEKYFKFKKDLIVKDIYDHNANTIMKDATLIEMIFEMTTRNNSKLFVIREGKLVGVVDRFTIIDKILYF